VGQPSSPSYLSGPTTVLTGALVRYNSGSANGATSYEWRLPYPFDVVSQFDYFGQRWQMRQTTGRNLQAFTGYAGTSGLVQVWGKNECGSGGARYMSVSHGSVGGPGGGGIPVSTLGSIGSDTGVKFYPNPVDHKLTIIGLVDNNTYIVKIISIDGKLILNKSVKGNKIEIDASHFSNGMYILDIQGENGITEKFIVQH